MEMTYDPEADAAYLTLGAPVPDGGVEATRSVDLGSEVNIDVDQEGQIIGIEFLDASARLGPEVLAQARRLT